MVMRRIFAIISAGLFVVASGVLSGTPVGAAEWWLQYSDRNFRTCMEVGGYNELDGTLILARACESPLADRADLQQFQLARLDNGNYSIIARASGRCLQHVPTGVPGLSDFVQESTCLSGVGRIIQEWQTPLVRENPNGSLDIMFRNVHTGKCISANGFFPDGAPRTVTQETCNRAEPRQVWRQHLREGGGRN